MCAADCFKKAQACFAEKQTEFNAKLTAASDALRAKFEMDRVSFFFPFFFSVAFARARAVLFTDAKRFFFCCTDGRHVALERVADEDRDVEDGVGR